MKGNREIHNYPCDFEGCRRVFLTAALLKRHTLVHTGEQPYECDICFKKFNQLGNLTAHKLRHESEHLKWDRSSTLKPFKCPYPKCVKSFTANASLKHHILTTHVQGSGLSSSGDKVPSTSTEEDNFECLTAGMWETTSEAAGCQMVQHLLLVAENQYLKSVTKELAEYVIEWSGKSDENKAAAVRRAKSLLASSTSANALDDILFPAGTGTERDNNLKTDCSSNSRSRVVVADSLMDEMDRQERALLNADCCESQGHSHDDHSHQYTEHGDTEAGMCCCGLPVETETTKRQKR